MNDLSVAKHNCDIAQAAFDEADAKCKRMRQELKAQELEAARLRVAFIDSVQQLKHAQEKSK